MMQRVNKELVVIGGGPAGMAAALAAYEAGLREIVIIERDQELGGILQQCIHNGFGVHYFQEELTGPEYAGRFIEAVEAAEIEVAVNTMVLEVTSDRSVYAVSRGQGMVAYQAQAVILAMGCRERTREALGIPGTRPAGILTAGTAQRYVNMEGYMPGRRVLILGSGDIGLIMARRMSLEGAEVLGVLEILPYSNGLARNVVQCLDDYEIPLRLQHTVVEIHGRSRLEGVTIAQVDDGLQPVAGTEEYLEVDTLLLSVGLIPENELSRQVGLVLDEVTGGPVVNQSRETSLAGVFACGNVLQVHDLVDYVTEEAQLAGRGAARWVLEGRDRDGLGRVQVSAGSGVRYVVPQMIDVVEPLGVELYLRVEAPMGRGVVRVSLLGDGDGDELELVARKERFLKPAEMVKVRLEGEQLRRLVDGQELVVVVEEG